MKLCSVWRADPSRSGKCLGEFIRRRVAEEFRQSDQTVLPDPNECARRLNSLRALASDRYSRLYPRISVSSASDLTRAECSKVIFANLHSPESGDVEQSLLEKLKKTFSFKSGVPESESEKPKK
ncbi:ubiquinol-cytochrome-c reductase complex assembly factor 2 [Amblyomma americanum]